MANLADEMPSPLPRLRSAYALSWGVGAWHRFGGMARLRTSAWCEVLVVANVHRRSLVVVLAQGLLVPLWAEAVVTSCFGEFWSLYIGLIFSEPAAHSQPWRELAAWASLSKRAAQTHGVGGGVVRSVALEAHRRGGGAPLRRPTSATSPRARPPAPRAAPKQRRPRRDPP